MLLVAEETTCGLGRCGPLLPALAWGVRPHVTCVGEAVGGGYCSVAAVLWEARGSAIAGALISDRLPSS